MFKSDAIEKWGNYTGRNTPPEDIAEFWEEAKREVDNATRTIHIEKVDYDSDIADVYQLELEGVKNGKVHCQYLTPKGTTIEKRPVILMFHGYHYSSGDWYEKLHFVSEGYIVVAMDVRGQGGKSIDTTNTSGGTDIGHIVLGEAEGPTNLFYRAIFQDVYQVTSYVMTREDVDDKRVYAYGGSQGGALALVCAALTKRICKVFVQYPFLVDYSGVYSEGAQNTAYAELISWFRQRDPLHLQEEKLFHTLSYIDVKNIVSFIPNETHVFWGMALSDITCPPKSQFAAYNRLTCPKTLYVYPDFGHEGLPQFNEIVRKEMK